MARHFSISPTTYCYRVRFPSTPSLLSLVHVVLYKLFLPAWGDMFIEEKRDIWLYLSRVVCRLIVIESNVLGVSIIAICARSDAALVFLYIILHGALQLWEGLSLGRGTLKLWNATSYLESYWSILICKQSLSTQFEIFHKVGKV